MANYTMTIGEMLSNSLTQNIFPSVYEFYLDDEQVRKAFEEKFINHYYYREIGFETPFMFIHKLESHLKLNMPYWKELYRTELEARDINFLLNKDLKETFIRELKSENQMSGTTSNQQNSTSSNSITQNATSSNTHKESSINDGVAQVSLENGYLTGAISDTGNNTNTGSSSVTDDIETTGTTSQSGNETALEKTELISQGNIGVTSSAQLLKEWREVLINMDKIIIDSCNDLFMKLY